MKKILTILITSLLWCSSSSANIQDNVLKWISKYDSLTADTKLILCIPVWENSKDRTIDLFHSVMIKDLEKKQESAGMYKLFIEIFGRTNQMQTVAYLSMSKDLESYLRGKNSLRNLDIYGNLNALNLYPKESLDLFFLSTAFLIDESDTYASEWIAKYELFTKCSNNYLSLTEENEKINLIKDFINTGEYKKILLEIQSENFAKKLQLKLKNKD